MKKLLKLMEQLPENMDAALVTSDVNRRYYTELKSSAGTLVVTRDASYLIIDSRYFEVASQTAVNCTVLLQDKLFEQIDQLLTKHKALKVGLESDRVTISQLEEFGRKLPEYTFVSDRTLSEQINNQRAVKCETEQGYMTKSQEITDKTFAYALTIIEEGKTELEIALAMELYSRQNGSEEPAFSFIVASGPNTSRPHAVPTDRKIEAGEFLLMDFGSTYKGYRSDMTRTVAVGEPSAKMKEVYNTVLTAQSMAMEQIKAGVSCRKIHEIAAEYINSTDYKGLFAHGLGHSLGLEVHEPPNFNAIETEDTAVGNIITVEPGIYIPGEFGVRIEDFVCITQDGFHNFTASPKQELIIL